MSTARRIGTVGALGIGVGSMLGAGVFSNMWASVLAAGRWYLLALGIAAAVATANALSTAQLAASHHEAGGAYAYGRAELNHFLGHLAGAGFVVGKTVSTAVAALVVAQYVGRGHAPLVASGAIAIAWALNARGITRTAAGATISAVVVTLALVAIAVGALSGTGGGTAVGPGSVAPSGSMFAVLVGASAAFFAFAGYARIATLSEEVRDPRRTVPRAIALALVIVFAVYALVAVALERTVGAASVAAASTDGQSNGASTPIALLAHVAGIPVAVVNIVAVLAVFGALLAVMAGAGRTLMAMARNRDAPARLATQASSGSPALAEAAIAACAIALAWTNAMSLIFVSVACVLLYYGVANTAAIAQRWAGRTSTLRVPVFVSVGGLIGCVVLGAAALPSIAGGLLAPLVLIAVVVGWPALAALRRR